MRKDQHQGTRCHPRQNLEQVQLLAVQRCCLTCRNKAGRGRGEAAVLPATAVFLLTARYLKRWAIAVHVGRSMATRGVTQSSREYYLHLLVLLLLPSDRRLLLFWLLPM